MGDNRGTDEILNTIFQAHMHNPPSSNVVLVRVGRFGDIGRFRSTDGLHHPRGVRVVCQTQRGLQVGEVLGCERCADGESCDGQLLRRVTVEDDLLLVRLEKRRNEAMAACETLLAARELPIALVDAELTFDGNSMQFFFLGEMSTEVEQVTLELAELYAQTVQLREFSKLVAEGCGPDCGTEQAEGCGTGCSSCAVASACKTPPAT